MWKTAKALVKRLIRRNAALDRLFRLYYYRAVKARLWGYPSWEKVLGKEDGRWAETLRASKGGPRVLLATSVGGYLAGATLESVLGAALALRGAEVHAFLCDGALPACFDCQVSWYPNQEVFARHGPSRDLCKTCFRPGKRLFDRLGFPVHRYGACLTEEDERTAARLAAGLSPDQMKDFVWEGLSVGQHALAGALRFYARADLEGEPLGERVLRRYFHAALLTVFAVRRLLDRHRFDVAVFSHGIYVPFGLIGEVARQRGVRVVNWNPAYRKQRFIFSHGDTYHHTLMDEPASAWENIEFTEEREAELMAYLRTRWHGTEDWIWFHDQPVTDAAAVAREIGVDFSKPTVGLLTNVMWDAQLHYPTNAFPNMREWVFETIRYFARRPELQLLIRVHPAEIRGTLLSRQPIIGEIRRAFPSLPSNVFIIPPESRISTYAAMERCNAVIIYGTKTGVELACLGQPVIVAGEAWVRNKGITLDAASPADYVQLLDKLPLREASGDERIRRARRYAYHFFFRRMIPLEFMEPHAGDPPYRLSPVSLEALSPGRSPGLDVICDGILKGTEFVYPAETFGDRERARGRAAVGA